MIDEESDVTTTIPKIDEQNLSTEKQTNTEDI